MLTCLTLAALLNEGDKNAGVVGCEHFPPCVPGKRASQPGVRKKSKAMLGFLQVLKFLIASPPPPLESPALDSRTHPLSLQ